jgi:hypothetical protein
MSGYEKLTVLNSVITGRCNPDDCAIQWFVFPFEMFPQGMIDEIPENPCFQCAYPVTQKD